MSIQEEIASQPECWRRAAAVEVEGLPRHGERVAVAGCGTSLFVAQAYAARREAAGHGETDAFAASEFPLGRRYDRLVAITRSGTTTEVLDLLARVEAPTLTISARTLPFADDRVRRADALRHLGAGAPAGEPRRGPGAGHRRRRGGAARAALARRATLHLPGRRVDRGPRA